MKKLILFILLYCCAVGYAQEKNTNADLKDKIPGVINTQNSSNVRICVPSRANMVKTTPLYIIKYGRKEYRCKNSGFLNIVSPNMIATINILKDSVAIKNYGDEAKNGIIIIGIKKTEVSEFKKKLNKYKAEQKHNEIAKTD
jgi:hypothetical protein|nr:hypothetical protein [uncultured Pedobacter sp.]